MVKSCLQISQRISQRAGLHTRHVAVSAPFPFADAGRKIRVQLFLRLFLPCCLRSQVIGPVVCGSASSWSVLRTAVPWFDAASFVISDCDQSMRLFPREPVWRSTSFLSVSIRAPRAGSRPGNRESAVNLEVESMGRCQFGCRDYALGTRMDRNRPRDGARPCSRHPN